MFQLHRNTHAGQILGIVTPLILSILFSCITGCLRETSLPVNISFEYKIESDFQTTPVIITIENITTGADFYEWTFEGGNPVTSNKKNPGEITFSEPGEHRITLKAWNPSNEAVKETLVRVDSIVNIKFDYQILTNDFSPVEVLIENQTTGASDYEWRFENGNPAVSYLENPGKIKFTEGFHTIWLKVSNGSESFITKKNIVIQPPLFVDCYTQPVFADEDMEAPLTMIVKNLSRSYLSITWSCDGGVIADKHTDSTTIRFYEPGNYTIFLQADNHKEQKTIQKEITIKENSGIYTFHDINFGISQAKNNIGCFFSADFKRVLLSKELVTTTIGASIDIGFFALNSSFDHCYFFSPHMATTSAFTEISSATETQIQNAPHGNNLLTSEYFSHIHKASDMDIYNFLSGSLDDYFVLTSFPVFVFFKTQDNRRGIIQIKNAVNNGGDSYIITDIKIEKRTNE